MGRSFAYQIWSESFGKIVTSRNRVVITNKFCLQASFLACISFLYQDHFKLLVSCDFPLTLRYDPGIMGVMPWAVGCLTGKNTLRCQAFLGECRAVFVDLFHFLLLLVTFFTGRKFCKLLFTGERGKVCYFFTGCNFEQLLFTGPGGPG